MKEQQNPDPAGWKRIEAGDQAMPVDVQIVVDWMTGKDCPYTLSEEFEDWVPTKVLRAAFDKWNTRAVFVSSDRFGRGVKIALIFLGGTEPQRVQLRTLNGKRERGWAQLLGPGALRYASRVGGKGHRFQ